MRKDIKSMYPEELEEMLREMGQPSYRAKQVFKWLHSGVNSFDEMTNISKDLRAKLVENCYISNATIEKN